MAPQDSSKKRKAALSTSTPPKKAKKETKPEKPATTKTEKRTTTKSTSKANAPKAAPAPAPVPAEDEIVISNDEDSQDEVEDDQTAALLKGFEDSSDEEAEDDAAVSADTAEITQIPELPQSASLKSALSAASTSSSPPGVIYLGRIPHGFYEHQMREYFVQFGPISRLRLSRNRTTGASRHFAFIEFEHEEVARIAADTMDNYLMFGHILKAKFVAKEQVHENLFKGAGKRFKKVPWNRIERMQLAGADRETFKDRVSREEKRRKNKAAQLKELGYEFETPALRQVDDVPVQSVKEVEAGEEQKAIEAPAADDEKVESAAKVESTPVKEEKAKKAGKSDSPIVKKDKSLKVAKSGKKAKTIKA